MLASAHFERNILAGEKANLVVVEWHNCLWCPLKGKSANNLCQTEPDLLVGESHAHTVKKYTF